MEIHQVYTESELRNFTYFIELEDGSALVIDPWDAAEVNRVLRQKQLSLRAIINTHEHWDHIQGNPELVAEHGCEVWAHSNGQGKVPGLSRMLTAGELIDLDGGSQLRVLDTPGHTYAHLCFLVLEQGMAVAVFTGDTLFNAGVGHCRSGDVDSLYQTISEQFNSLDDNVLVYPGHDYLENNLRFTLSVETDNRQAKEWLPRAIAADLTVAPLVTCIGDEREFNSFFRLANTQIRKCLSAENATDKEVFVKLRSLRDSW
ncbi:MAG: hydroxyacylglutathione hydrolase [Oceanicoccus sp.]